MSDNGLKYYDRGGQPITEERCIELYGKDDYRFLRRTPVHTIDLDTGEPTSKILGEVITIWLGCDYDALMQERSPHVFRAQAFRTFENPDGTRSIIPEGCLEERFYMTEAIAFADHEAMATEFVRYLGRELKKEQQK